VGRASMKVVGTRAAGLMPRLESTSA